MASKYKLIVHESLPVCLSEKKQKYKYINRKAGYRRAEEVRMAKEEEMRK